MTHYENLTDVQACHDCLEYLIDLEESHSLHVSVSNHITEIQMTRMAPNVFAECDVSISGVVGERDIFLSRTEEPNRLRSDRSRNVPRPSVVGDKDVDVRENGSELAE